VIIILKNKIRGREKQAYYSVDSYKEQTKEKMVVIWMGVVHLCNIVFLAWFVRSFFSPPPPFRPIFYVDFDDMKTRTWLSFKYTHTYTYTLHHPGISKSSEITLSQLIINMTKKRKKKCFVVLYRKKNEGQDIPSIGSCLKRGTCEWWCSSLLSICSERVGFDRFNW